MIKKIFISCLFISLFSGLLKGQGIQFLNPEMKNEKLISDSVPEIMNFLDHEVTNGYLPAYSINDSCYLGKLYIRNNYSFPIKLSNMMGHYWKVPFESKEISIPPGAVDTIFYKGELDRFRYYNDTLSESRTVFHVKIDSLVHFYALETKIYPPQPVYSFEYINPKISLKKDTSLSLSIINRSNRIIEIIAIQSQSPAIFVNDFELLGYKQGMSNTVAQNTGIKIDIKFSKKNILFDWNKNLYLDIFFKDVGDEFNDVHLGAQPLKKWKILLN